MSNSTEKKAVIELVKLCYESTSADRANNLLKRCKDNKLNKIIGEAGIAGVLNYYLNANPNIHLSQSTKKVLKQHAGMIGIKNSIIAQQLAILAGKFNSRGIKYIVLKGLPLANSAYQNDSMRAVSDIDILINRHNYEQVKEVLDECGYVFPEKKFISVSERYSQEWIERERSEILFTKEGILGEGLVDVHFDLNLFGKNDKFNRMFPLNDYDWFGNTRDIEIEGEKIRCMAPEAELAYCIAHFAIQHSFMGIKWLIDICQARSCAADLYNKGKEGLFSDNLNFTRITDITYRLSDELINVNNETSHFAFSLNRKYKNRLFDDPDSPLGKVKRKLYKAWLPAKVSDRMKFILNYLFVGDAIKHRLKASENVRFDILQPFKICAVFIKERRRQKRN